MGSKNQKMFGNKNLDLKHTISKVRSPKFEHPISEGVKKVTLISKRDNFISSSSELRKLYRNNGL